jgi:uncharacterized protein YbjT (DUF2867 family)
MMKITVMGATGRIGTHLVEKLEEAGVEVVAASTSLGVNSATGTASEPQSRGPTL